MYMYISLGDAVPLSSTFYWEKENQDSKNLQLKYAERNNEVKSFD